MIYYFVNTLLVNLIILLNYKRIVNFFNIYDFPDKKLKKHKKKIPLMGGLIIVINILLLLITSCFLSEKIFIFENNREFIVLVLFIISFFLIGLYDDKFNLKPINKIIFLILIAITCILINDKLLIKYISLSFFDRNIFLLNASLLFTVFCIIILLNSINFYDGINCQAIVFFIIIFTYLCIKFNYNLFYLFIVINLFFLLFLNIGNKLFLGDSGIYFLAALLSFCLIYEYNVYKNFIYADEIFILLSLPGFDLFRLSCTRILEGKNAFLGDRNHIHHLLNRKFSLFTSNFVLILLVTIPILAMEFTTINRLLLILINVFIYSTIIIFLKNDN